MNGPEASGAGRGVCRAFVVFPGGSGRVALCGGGGVGRRKLH